MLKTYKILSILLDYPDEGTKKLLPIAVKLLEKESLLNKKSIRQVERFVDSFKDEDLIDWQQTYTALFDYMTPTSLYLFDHLYGDSKKRGMAMVDLKQFYTTEGMEIASNELPDYLPLYLEFIADTQSVEHAADLLSEISKILRDISDNLNKMESPYSMLIDPLLYLASKGNAKQLTVEEEKELAELNECEACFFNKIK